MPSRSGTRRLKNVNSFNPQKYGPVSLWFDASKITGLNDSDPVSTWVDYSGNGRDATQGTAAKKPLYKVAPTGFGGRPGVTFDGVDDFLATPSWSLTVFTAFVVFRASGTAGATYWGGVSSGQPYLYGSQPMVEMNKGVNTSDKNSSVNWAVDGTTRVFTHLFNGTHATHTTRSNGTAVSLTNGGATADPGSGSQSQAWGLGARSDGGVFFMNGTIAEVLVYGNTFLDTSACQAIERYLGKKYGVTIA